MNNVLKTVVLVIGILVLTLVAFAGPKRQDPFAVHFQGNKIFSSEQLLSRMKESLGTYKFQEIASNPELLDYAVRRFTDSLRSDGYLQARCGEPEIETGKDGLVINLSVDEGALYRLGEIKILHSEHISPEQIRELLSLKSGDVAKGELIANWLYEDLKHLYGTMGFIQYTAEPVPAFRPIGKAQTEGIVDFNVYIDEGKQFRIRSIKLLRSDNANKDFRDLVVLRPGDVFDQGLFEQIVSQLNGVGLFEKIDEGKDIDFRTDEEVSLLDIVIRLKAIKVKT